MTTNLVVLRDADEIEEFFVRSTGMKPSYLQLSRGPAALRLEVTDLAGVTLIWTRAKARARWRDQMTGANLHIGFAVESQGHITARGQALADDIAQIWMPGNEMDLIMNGPNLTLEIAVDARLVNGLGWAVSGDPLRRVPRDALRRLLRTCQRASDAMRVLSADTTQASLAVAALWRDQVLDELEPVLQTWLTPPDSALANSVLATSQYELVQRADDVLERIDFASDAGVDAIANQLGVPRRTLFSAYQFVLGVGPRRYLELRRLHRLRCLLKRADRADTTVTSLASGLGIADLGRLAERYRSVFGENPSVTLKRAGAYDA